MTCVHMMLRKDRKWEGEEGWEGREEGEGG